MLETGYWILIGIGAFLLLAALLYFGVGVIQNIRMKNKLKKWSDITKNSNVLIVHCPGKAKTIPSPSPFVMKLLTFLRMSEIPYELDHTDPFGGKGKTPWISLQGENLADSEFIITFLSKKYGKNMNGIYPEDQIATATAVRMMLEEHMFWGMILERFVYGPRKNLLEVFNVPALVGKLFKRAILGRAQSQGIGGHEYSDVIDLISKDLRVTSKILGNKKFILGDDPCVDDAAIFGQLSQFYWGLPHSPYEKLLNGDVSNLREYCFRVREKYWQDWK